MGLRVLDEEFCVSRLQGTMLWMVFLLIFTMYLEFTSLLAGYELNTLRVQEADNRNGAGGDYTGEIRTGSPRIRASDVVLRSQFSLYTRLSGNYKLINNDNV